MRPRLFTAENLAAVRQPHLAVRGFNEAAALHRGKPRLDRRLQGRSPAASMRPRLFTAENLTDANGNRSGNHRFNEAAALHRGKPARQWGNVQYGVRASMRPRLFTAENPSTITRYGLVDSRLQ